MKLSVEFSSLNKTNLVPLLRFLDRMLPNSLNLSNIVLSNYFHNSLESFLSWLTAECSLLIDFASFSSTSNNSLEE